ncbi:MAG: M3 family oligoendopeptidase [Rhodothermales bacterium]|nr:M3 family oligoendopeptidase [Rhodothermales bacterium]
MADEPATGAEKARWNLEDLYPSRAALEQDMASASLAAGVFRERYYGKVDTLDASQLARSLEELEAVIDPLGRAYTYAYLHWVTDTNDQSRGALLQKVKEEYTATSQALIFFDLEWARTEEARSKALLEQESLRAYRHYLELLLRRKDYMLSEAEEKILADLDISGRSAWNRYFDESLSALRFDFDGKSISEQEVLSKLHQKDRAVRRMAAMSLTDGLKTEIRTLTFISNTLLADKNIKDRVRGYPHWLASRNLDNEVPDDTVEALVEAVTSRYDLVERFYGLKRKLLGLDEMFDYDRYAPVGESDRRYKWTEAREVVLDAYSGFHPQVGEIATRFFDESWIDAPVSEGKRGGAFSHGAVPSAHPYIMMNFTGRIRDVQTLAHELGHGVHQYLSRGQGVLQADTPLTTAETASVFGEMIVFQRLMESESDPRNRLAMLVGKIDDTVATVFRQVAMNRYEHAVHTERRSAGELTTDRFCELWLQTQKEMFRGSVTLGDHYRYWWSYIPHFLHTPGYVYAYAFGELLVLALYKEFLKHGDTFPDKYVDLLRAGGSDWPHILVGRLGVDLTDLDFWKQGLTAIDELIGEAEKLAAATA